MSIETDLSAYRLADDAIGLFLEYRDKHGYSEQEARAAAATETQQGIDAEVELRASGTCRQQLRSRWTAQSPRA